MDILEDAFLATIREHPDDDAPRLIFADWLEDHGDPDRATFIRLQVDRARCKPHDLRQRKLLALEEPLLHEHEHRWRETLPHLDGVTWEDFSRGFVEGVFVPDVDTLLRHSAEIFEAAPIRRLHIGVVNKESLHLLAGWTPLANLSELNLGNNPGMGDGLRYLARSPHVGNLTSLLLHYNNLGEQVAELTRSSHLSNLRELYLSGNDLHDEHAAPLAQTEHLPHLAELDLRDNRISDGTARALAYGDRRDALETLWLVNNFIGPGGGWALAGTPHLPRLERLYLNYNPLGDEVATAFAESPHRRALRELDLRHCAIRDRGARALAASPFLEDIQLLWLGGNRLGSDTCHRLRQRFGERLRL